MTNHVQPSLSPTVNLEVHYLFQGASERLSPEERGLISAANLHGHNEGVVVKPRIEQSGEANNVTRLIKLGYTATREPYPELVRATELLQRGIEEIAVKSRGDAMRTVLDRTFVGWGTLDANPES